ncbi:hypothetical protein ACFLQQ_03740, partial [Actinomycetota bacterium]
QEDPQSDSQEKDETRKEEEDEIIIPQDDSPNWILAIGGEGRDYAPSVTVTDDGYVAVGMTTSFGHGNGTNSLDGFHDFMAVRLDKKGELMWSTVIGGPEDERGSFSVTPASDGGFLLTGTTRSFGSGGADLFVVKLDPRGRLKWARAIGGSGQETGKTTLEVDGGFISLGDTTSAGAGKRDLMAVKFDRDGNIIWANAIGGMEDDTGAGISEINGGFIIGGTIWSYGAGAADGCFIKIDSSGDVQWSKTVGGPGDEGINWDGVRVLSDGGFVLGEGTTSYGAKKQAICAMRLDSDCSVKWALLVDGPGDDAGWTMNKTSDGYIAGGKYDMAQNGGDTVYIKINSNGEYLWARTLGDERLDEIEEIIPAGQGYIMAGVTRLAEPNGDFLIAKVGKDGFVGGDADPVQELMPASVRSVDPEVNSFSPMQTDVSSLINVLSVSPDVETPNLRIDVIHRN